VREHPMAEDDPNQGMHAIANSWWGATKRCSRRLVVNTNLDRGKANGDDGAREWLVERT